VYSACSFVYCRMTRFVCSRRQQVSRSSCQTQKKAALVGNGYDVQTKLQYRMFFYHINQNEPVQKKSVLIQVATCLQIKAAGAIKTNIRARCMSMGLSYRKSSKAFETQHGLAQWFAHASASAASPPPRPLSVQ
jgi:hypothetical protein